MVIVLEWRNELFNWTVYVHITPNLKYYVGITSKNPVRRWAGGYNYRTQLFYRAIQKYGWDNIEHLIVASNLSEVEAKNFEKILIRNLKSNCSDYGYNCTIGGEGITGYKHSADFVEKCRKRLLGTNRPHKDETKIKIGIANKGKYEKKVSQFALDGSFISKYYSIGEAGKQTATSPSNIGMVANGKRKSAGGYLWKFS